MNYVRRQQYPRLSHAGRATLASAVATLLGLAVTTAGAAASGGPLLLTAVFPGLYARRWLSLGPDGQRPPGLSQPLRGRLNKARSLVRIGTLGPRGDRNTRPIGGAF